MPLFANKPAGDAAGWEPQAADSRLAHTAGVAARREATAARPGCAANR